MPVYTFVWNILAWTITVAILGLVAFPWAILAFKINRGAKEADEEVEEELLMRSWLFGWAVAGVSAAITFVDYASITWLDLPEGPLHAIYLVALLSLASWWAMYFFSLEDFFSGLSFILIYLYIPTFVLAILYWVVNWNIAFTYIRSWLPTPTEL